MGDRTNRQIALYAAIEAVSTYETQPFLIAEKVLPVADAFYTWLEGGEAPKPLEDEGTRCTDPLCAYAGEVVTRSHTHTAEKRP